MLEKDVVLFCRQHDISDDYIGYLALNLWVKKTSDLRNLDWDNLPRDLFYVVENNLSKYNLSLTKEV